MIVFSVIHNHHCIKTGHVDLCSNSKFPIGLLYTAQRTLSLTNIYCTSSTNESLANRYKITPLGVKFNTCLFQRILKLIAIKITMKIVRSTI